MKAIIAFIGLWFVVAASLQAQTIITGVVTDSSHKPIPYATVYLSKTTYGVITNGQGAYSLIIPQDGIYELISSCVGYESHYQTINAKGQNKKLDIELSERIILIKEVTVKGKDTNRGLNYNLFKRCFIGETINAPFCTIQNPKDLIVYRDSRDSNLIAYSAKPLIIINSRLDYEIYYDLKHFCYNFHSGQLRFLGDYYFKDISNQKQQTSRVNHYRLDAYNGSRMHFLRALFADSLRQENFELCNIGKDSCGNNTMTHSVNGDELSIALTPDSMALYHFNPILIYYLDRNPEPTYLSFSFNFCSWTITSRIDFSDTLQVYKYGYYTDAYSISWSGNMVDRRIAEMLPYDFVPKTAEQKIPKGISKRNGYADK
jgi:hypothetical protein